MTGLVLEQHEKLWIQDDVGACWRMSELDHERKSEQR
jgi:hypothetical protein